MTAAVLTRPPEHAPYEPRGAARQVWCSRAPEVLSCGVADCIAGETKIYDPVQDKHIPVKELYEKQQAPVVQTLIGPVQAEVPFRKGVDRIYRLTTADGRSCLVTGQHRVLTQHGWTFVSACSSGLWMLVSAPIPQEKCSDIAPSMSQTDVHHWNYRDASLKDHYFGDYCQYGGPLLKEEDTALSSVPLRDDVHVHTHANLHKDGMKQEQEYILPYLLSDLHATSDYSLSSEKCAYAQYCYAREKQKHGSDWFQYASQSLNTKHLPLPIAVLPQHVDNMHRPFHNWHEYPLTLEDVVLDQWWHGLLQLLSLYSMSSGMSLEWWLSVLLLDVYNLSSLPSCKFDYTMQWTTVSSIEYVRTDEYFDLHVPGAEHYLAEGIWHHNSGKSRGWIEKLHYCADKYPGARLLIVRKTRESITQSAMVTYEKKVLPTGWLGNLIRFKTSEQQYEYPNGSIIAVGGMDKPSKIMSSEWDFIFVQEAVELNEEDWEILSIRKRNGVMPYQQLGADCNPSYPTHWLKRRCDKGLTKLFTAIFADNPTITPERVALLERLTGVRRQRLYFGQWAAAEGLVYSEWNPAVHLMTRQQMYDWQLLYTDGTLNRQVIRHVFASIDWGYAHAGVIQIWGVDSESRMYLLCEVYRTKKTDDWWREQALDLDREFHVELWVADPSQPAYIRKFNEAGLLTIQAINDVIPGITAMQSRLQIQPDGRPRMYIYEYALRDRDELRDEAHQPVWFEGEINEYVWAKSKDGQPVKEVPIKINDDSMDCSRYAVMYMDSGGGERESDEETAQALRNYRGY